MVPPVSPAPDGKKPEIEQPEVVKFIAREATLDDLVLALRICRKRGGEGKAWCRVIGDWFKNSLVGYVGLVGDEPATFILGRIKGHYFHIRHWTRSPVLEGYNPNPFMFCQLKDALPDNVKFVVMTVDERDTATHHMLAGLKFKAMGLKPNWYAKGHDGIAFHYPIGRFDK